MLHPVNILTGKICFVNILTGQIFCQYFDRKNLFREYFYKTIYYYWNGLILPLYTRQYIFFFWKFLQIFWQRALLFKIPCGNVSIRLDCNEQCERFVYRDKKMSVNIIKFREKKKPLVILFLAKRREAPSTVTYSTCEIV